MKRVRCDDGYHYLYSPQDFADLISEKMGDDSADLFLDVITNVDDARNMLKDLNIEPDPEMPSSDKYTVSEAVDLLQYATEW